MMLAIVVLIVIIIDQFSKFVIQSNMTQMQSIPIIPQIFHLTYVQNPGAAFSIFPYRTSFFIAITLIAVFLSLYFYFRVDKDKFLLRLGIALQLGGALGNLIDRVRIGQVVDFFDFRIWPVFNFADSAIVIGVTLICWELVKPVKIERQED